MNLLVNKSRRILHITLNRPEKRNALTLEMSSGITEAIESAQQNADVGCILLAATGSVFCSGMDLDEANEVHASHLDAAHEKLFTIGSRSAKPIVIAAQGTALGGGLGLVAQGHVVYAADGAAFGLPEIRVGLWPFLVYRSVSAAIGARRTLELSLTGQHFSAGEAYEWGLVHRVCPSAETGDRAKAKARQLARSSPSAIACGMQYVREAAEKSWEDAGSIAASLRGELMKSADFSEGRLAFKEKREPRWPSMPPGFYDAG